MEEGELVIGDMISTNNNSENGRSWGSETEREREANHMKKRRKIKNQIFLAEGETSGIPKGYESDSMNP